MTITVLGRRIDATSCSLPVIPVAYPEGVNDIELLQLPLRRGLST